MFDKIKRLGTDTAIYGVSTILGRFLNFILVPFYTNVLHPSDYGVVSYIYSLIAFANVVYAYGMETAYFKYSSTLETGTARQNFSTPFVSLASTSILFSFALILLSSPLADAIHLSVPHHEILLYTAGMLFFDTIAIIPFAALRMERKAKQFAAIKFLNILINVTLNMVLLLGYHMGVEGIFISGVVSSLITFIVLLPVAVRHGMFDFNSSLLKSLLKFGLPSVPAGLAAMAIQVIDRPILRALTDDTTVGIYQANYRLGIFMMLIVSMYDYAWRPFYFSVSKESNAKEIFSRVLTYLMLFMMGIFLFLTLFIGDIVKLQFMGHYLIHPDYWSGLNIVPIVLLGYVFLGVSNNVSAGIYIEKKTLRLPWITFVGAFVNVAANYFLIPSMGMLGAAWATLFAYFAMTVAMYVVAQRVYPIQYEFGRLAKIAGATAIVVLMYSYINISSFEWLLKIGLLVLFVIIMYAMKFFERSELEVIKKLFSRTSSEVVQTKEELLS